ncbi:MAG TPA: glycosyl hydrolase family 18 protein [Albitalea sp.]|uniref:glycosyl hydrolase family 18 protein n=1 Tax=Piscinibacter sp. TaxID=1903157 RepID=UPI002ED4F04F
MRRIVIAGVLAAASQVHAAPPVIGWVPPYALAESMQGLEATPGVGAGLTRIGLQFWNPSADGRRVVFAPIDKTGQPVTPADVARFRDWARKRGIPVLLTVYNNSQVLGRWDWALARNAFINERAAFTAALVAEMDRHGLDGIDVDLEGEGDLEVDREPYARFIDELSKVLKARGKLLTVDSFHSPCANAPNMRWWADWKGRIDAIHSMGYADLYEGSTETFTPPGKAVCEGGAAIFKYSWQLQYGAKAGYTVEQIVLGMPTWVDNWGQGDALVHLREAKQLGAGIALWDLQLAAPGWRTPAAWEAVRALRP